MPDLDQRTLEHARREVLGILAACRDMHRLHHRQDRERVRKSLSGDGHPFDHDYISLIATDRMADAVDAAFHRAAEAFHLMEASAARARSAAR